MVHRRVAADNGYNLSEELTTRENTAANILTTASNTLGADSAEVLAAQTALNDFSACLQAVQNGGKSQSLTSLPYYQGSAMHALYQPIRHWALPSTSCMQSCRSRPMTP